MAEVVVAGDVICNLKAAVAALECQHKLDLEREERLRRQEEKKEKEKKKKKMKKMKPQPPPMFMMIPIESHNKGDVGSVYEDKMKRARRQRHEHGGDSNGDCADSISSSDSRRTSDRRRDECDENKGPTMRGGVLHTRCYCIHRDGLQDFCPLTECRGHPDCLTKPWPVCRPARYFQARFPDNYPASTCHDTITF